MVTKFKGFWTSLIATENVVMPRREEKRKVKFWTASWSERSGLKRTSPKHNICLKTKANFRNNQSSFSFGFEMLLHKNLEES